MAPLLVIVDPNGDLLVTLPTADDSVTNAASEQSKQDNQKSQFLISSKHMMLVSPVFRAMLQPGFKEGTMLQSEGKVEVSLPDHAGAFTILIDIIHCRLKRVPLKVDLHMLLEIAILVDKYQMYEVVDVFSDIWVRELVATLPKTYSADVLPWLCISWVFELEDQFKQLTRILESERTWQDDLKMIEGSLWDLPIPESVTSE